MRHRHQNKMNAANDMHNNSSYIRMKIWYLLGFTRLPLSLVDICRCLSYNNVNSLNEMDYSHLSGAQQKHAEDAYYIDYNDPVVKSYYR